MGKKRKEQVIQTPRRISRKELRKEQRLLKKQARLHYFEIKKQKLNNFSSSENVVHKKSIGASKHGKQVLNNQEKLGNGANSIELSPKKQVVRETNPKKTHDKLINKMKDQRKRQLIDANKDEEKEIKYLEKKLKLANKKSISSSKAFVESGLDYILDVCDSERIHNALSSEVNFEDSDSDFFEDYSIVQNNDVKNEDNDKEKSNICSPNTNSVDSDECKLTLNKSDAKRVHFNLKDDGLSDSEIEFDGESSDGESVGETTGGSDQETLIKSSDLDDQPLGGEVWEDIYGRLRDKKGNVLEENKGKYIPPHLRNSNNNEEFMKRKEMLRLLKGLLNRLALNNMHSIANQVEELFSKHSRNSVNEALFSLYVDSLVSPVLSPERLIVDHAMLIAILHGNIGSEISAYMLQNLVNKFSILFSETQSVENKELDNLLHLISYLYSFKTFESCLVYDILNRLSTHLTEKNIDLILVVLKSVGFLLRKDNPLAMKDFLLTVQRHVNQASDAEDCSRMKYMLEILLSIKNNNISKLSDFDPAHHENLKKVLKSVLRTGNSIVPLKIGLDDLLNAEKRGRWWLVGSAWHNDDEVKEVKKNNVPQEEFSAQLLALAKKQKMNTDNRRNIFCILMSAEDYQDAFEKVLRLGLKGQQEREIPLVLVHCLLHEKNYNPYYAHIADQLCTSNRRHQMSLQCALWDRFRALEKLSTSQICLLAKFLAQLVVTGSLPISVLKVVEFTELDKRHIRLLRQTILSIANVEAIDSMREVFERVSKCKKLSLFREALRLFIHHFILRNMPEGDLKNRVLLINSILSGDVS